MIQDTHTQRMGAMATYFVQMLGNQVALAMLGNQVALQRLGNQVALQMLGIRGFFFGRDGSRGPSGLAAFGVVLL